MGARGWVSRVCRDRITENLLNGLKGGGGRIELHSLRQAYVSSLSFPNDGWWVADPGNGWSERGETSHTDC